MCDVDVAQLEETLSTPLRFIIASSGAIYFVSRASRSLLGTQDNLSHCSVGRACWARRLFH